MSWRHAGGGRTIRTIEIESDLSLSQLALLDAVATHGPPLVGQIAAHAGVSGPSATRMLKQLERKGVMTRQRSNDDERKVLVALTERGRKPGGAPAERPTGEATPALRRAQPGAA
jgi:DNA-binding MarR family transcriptional regulator